MPFWERRREDGGRLLAELQTLAGRDTAVAALRDMIVETDAVLARIQPSAVPE